jgi:hypothetical protein
MEDVMKYKQFVAGVAALIVSVCLAPTASWAADYCLTFPSAPSYLLVGRNFKIPGKGKCKQWTGFTPQNSLNSPTSGVGCTSSDGTNFTLTLTTNEGGVVIFDSASLDTSSQSGTDNEYVIDYGPLSSGVNGGKCRPKDNPIPAVPAQLTHATAVGLQSNP